jgi:hypothetical protein
MNTATMASHKMWRNIGKRQLLVLIAGGAMALGIAGTVTWKLNEDSAQLVSRPVSSATHFRTVDSYLTYYVVDSDAQRQFVLNSENEATNEREGAGLSSLGLSYSIVQFRNAEDEAAFAGEVNLIADPTFHVNIVDMRGQALP